MTDKDKLLFAVAVLRSIAMSYRERLDRADHPPYVYAGLAAQFLGEDLSAIPPQDDLDRVNELLTEFRQFNKGQV